MLLKSALPILQSFLLMYLKHRERGLEDVELLVLFVFFHSPAMPFRRSLLFGGPYLYVMWSCVHLQTHVMKCCGCRWDCVSDLRRESEFIVCATYIFFAYISTQDWEGILMHYYMLNILRFKCGASYSALSLCVLALIIVLYIIYLHYKSVLWIINSI